MTIQTEMMTFIAVVEEKSFTRAAQMLAITTTAVSKQIKLLETRLGQQLLQRDTRTVTITDIGEQFYAHCKRVQREMVAAEAFIQNQFAKPQGRLRVLCSFMFEKAYLLEHLQEFHELYPELELEIELADRIPDMEREGFDIIVGFPLLPQIAPKLHQRALINTHYLLCIGKKYLATYGAPKTLQDLKDHKFITHPLRHPINRIQFADGTQIYMKTPEIIVNSMEALIKLCCDGAGILLVSHMQVKELLQRGELVQILQDYPLEKVTSYLFYRHSEYEQQKIRCFIDFYLGKIQPQ